MRLQLCLVAVATVFLFSLFTSASGYNLVCYFSSWAIYRNLSGKFDVSDIDANLCTHINFAFIELFEDGSLYVVDPWESNDDDEGGHYHGFSNLKKLKETNPSLKILLSLGGWNEGSKNFSIVAADATKRQKLAWECLNLIEKYSFDGLDIDWEYPTLRADSHPEDKENFIAMLKDFYDIMKPKGLMLTAALAGAVDKIEAAYDVERVQQYLDMLNIMTYDYHGAFDNFVGHISPLHPSKPDYEHGRNSTYTVATGLQYWLYKNADPTKLNMGIPTYARVFTLADKENTELYAPIAGPGEKGLFTGLAGTLSYQEICALTSDSTCYWDDEQMVPHCVWDDQWAGFDNERSIEKKIDFAMSQNIAGIMVWSLDTDDFNGYCSNDKYPLVNTIKNRLQYHEELKKKQGK